jgi:hypothetical protein
MNEKRQWPDFRDRRAHRDASIERAEADGQITVEHAPLDPADREREIEARRQATMVRVGDKLISPAVPGEPVQDVPAAVPEEKGVKAQKAAPAE